MQGEKTTLWSVKMTEQFDREFKEVARYRGQTRAGVFRQMVKNAHKQLPDGKGEKV